MTQPQPISLLSSSSEEEEGDDDDDSGTAPAIKRSKQFVSTCIRFSSDEGDSDSDIPPASVFAHPSGGSTRQPGSGKPHNAAAMERLTKDVSSFSSSEDESSVDSRAKMKRDSCSMEHPKSQSTLIECRSLKLLEKQRHQREKEQRKEKERRERENHRLALREDKKNRKLEAHQTTGKFAKDEIGLLVHPELKQGWSDETWTTLIKSYSNVLLTERIENRAIHFIRRDYLAGGAHHALQAYQSFKTAEYQVVDRLLIIFTDPNDFLQLLTRSDVEDDYPRLENWLEEMYTSWRIKFKTSKHPRVVVLLPGLIDAIRRQWNAASQAERLLLATEANISDAIVWLHVAFCVECQLVKSEEQALEFLLTMTRAISEEPYVQHVTELDCVQKLKSNVPTAAPPIVRAQDTWIRMLQQIPGMSATRAEQIAQHYPTAWSLWETYQNTIGEAEETETSAAGSANVRKAYLVANLFGERGQLKKLSEHLFRTMTSENPNELLH